MVRFRLGLMLLTPLFLLLMAMPSWALATPDEVKALSSAGTPVGQAILGPNGQPFLDPAGNPVTVTGVRTDPGNATPVSIANALKVPMGDLVGYAGSVGINLPLLMTGTITTVTRSDGGMERVFSYASASGDRFVFLADQTGPNVFGIRIANVHADGQGAVLTGHGLNGNFTNPPWWLTAAARQNYFLTTQVARILPPPGGEAGPATATAPSGPALATTGSPLRGRMNFASDLVIGNAPVSISGARKRLALAASK